MGKLTALKQSPGVAPRMCAVCGGQDMGAVFAPRGEGEITSCRGTDVRWAVIHQGNQ